MKFIHKKTLFQIIAALQRHLRENGRPEIAILDASNPTFDITRKTLDAKMKALTSQGIGVSTKSAQPLTIEQEEKLWEIGLFGIHSADALLNTVFLYN